MIAIGTEQAADTAAVIVGHVRFSPVTIEVAPHVGLTAGGDALVVLGDPEYFVRFGFAPASHFGLRSVYGGTDGSFMALELTRGALAGAHGLVRYCAEFDAL